MSNRGWWLGRILCLVVAGVTIGLLVWPGGGPAWAAQNQRRPNIVFVLTDDFDWGLVKYMPHVIALERAGTTFNHYIVADSMCCPSRSTIFTGLFPHDTGVVANTGPNGGYPAFKRHHDERKTFAVATQRAGYLNSMMGKYLNGYGDRLVNGDFKGSRMTHHVPPGWSDWHVSNAFGYLEFNYPLNENRRVVHYGNALGSESLQAVVLGGNTQAIEPKGPYMTDVLTRRAKAFINRAAAVGKPFLMEVATFAPHRPFTPAPRDFRAFPGLRAPRDPSFNAPNINPPLWLGRPQRLEKNSVAKIDTEYRARAQSVQDVDRLLATVEAELKARGLAGNTYIVFSSDNGYHMGQHRLLPAKETAFETDIRVPLIVAGPGVPRKRTVSRVVQNIDLYPTFVQLAGGRPNHAIDGRSLVPLLHPGGKPQPWRTVALVEHASPPALAFPGEFDPDLDYAVSFAPGLSNSNPDPYHAIRISNRQFGNAVYVEYTFSKSEHEYYNIDRDPYERDNIYRTLSPGRRNHLHAMLMALVHCHSAAACWKAGLPQG